MRRDILVSRLQAIEVIARGARAFRLPTGGKPTRPSAELARLIAELRQEEQDLLDQADRNVADWNAGR